MRFVTAVILSIMLVLQILRQFGLWRMSVKREMVMKIKPGILVLAALGVMLSACAGAQSGTDVPKQTVNSGGEEITEESADENAEASAEIRPEYFEEADCLPVPSSVFPEIFTFRTCDINDTFKIYSYSMATDDMETAKENYKKYLYYLRDLGGFGFIDATKELKMNGIYITYGEKCVAIVSLSQSDDDTCKEMNIAFGDNFDQILKLYHKDELSSSANANAPSDGSIELSQGNYSVPEDISAGKYDIEIGSSAENALSSVHYYKDGRAEGIYAIKSNRGYNGLELEAGDTLEISGDSIILKRR